MTVKVLPKARLRTSSKHIKLAVKPIRATDHLLSRKVRRGGGCCGKWRPVRKKDA